MAHTLQNEHWQADILPDLGASIANARFRYSGNWIDIIRPMDVWGASGSFLMLPWANRIRSGKLVFDGETHQLKTRTDENTARHGDVRKRQWHVLEQHETVGRYRFDSAEADGFNWPFTLTSEQTFQLEDADFVWGVSLTNTDSRPFPAGFGFHPYFQRHAPNMPMLHVPCNQQFVLRDNMPDAYPIPVQPQYDFREPRQVDAGVMMDHLFTGCDTNQPLRLIYEDWNLTLEIHRDPIFAYTLVFTAPDGTLAVEPQTNATDGFNLMRNGIEDNGVFVLQPGETVSGEVRLRLVTT
ncbi:MAG: hypothetical protein AAF125_17145 [Chloroflexota bacterium]